KKKRSIRSREAVLRFSNIPSPKLWVTGESTPSKTAYAPANSIHSARVSGNRRRRESANWAHAYPSARSKRLESARSENIGVLCHFMIRGETEVGHQDRPIL